MLNFLDKVKWGCLECGARGEIEQAQGIRMDQTVRLSLPAIHRNASPGCKVEFPFLGDEAYEKAGALAVAQQKE